MEDSFEVGVVCLTFNQVDYIAQCLESLVGQKTDFKYRVIVHDDASTDGTSDIARDFAARYPEKVVAIIQEKNVYSRGLSLLSFTAEYTHGCKYLAICEGDDWWESNSKLQRQYEYMENHPGCSACVHNVRYYDESKQRYVGVTPGCSEDRDYSLDEIIVGGGGLFGSNSFFYKVADSNMPDTYKGWGVGDYPRAIWLGSRGVVHCLKDELSSYRINAKGSWTSRHGSDPKLAKQTNDKIIAGLMKADEALSFSHHEAFMTAVQRQKDDTLWVEINAGYKAGGNRVKPGDIDDPAGFISRQPFRLKLAAIVKLYFPFVNRLRLLVR